MKSFLAAAVMGIGALTWSGTAQASTFAGYSETSDVYFDGPVEFDYDPFFLGVTVIDPDFRVDMPISPDLGTGSLLLRDAFFSVVVDGALLDTAVHVDNGPSDDTFSALFELSTGATDYAIATFTGDLDGLGLTDFFVDGVLFQPGNFRIVGATKDETPVVPLPAGLILLVTGFGSLVIVRRRRGLA